MGLRGPKPKYNDAADFQKAVEKFFDECEKNGELPGFAQMCIYLGLSERTLDAYTNEHHKDHDKYAGTLEWAKLKREAIISNAMFKDPKGANGYMNLLKQKKNGGYVDRPQQEGGKMELTINLAGLGGEANFKG